MGECGGHAVVFEAPGRVHPFILEPEPAGVHPHILADLVGDLEERLALADRDDLVGRRKRQKLAEPPDAREVQWVEPVGPLGLELGEAAGDGQSIPVVDDVDEVAAFGTGEGDLIHRKGGPARWIEAALIRQVDPGRRRRGGRRHQIRPTLGLDAWVRLHPSKDQATAAIPSRDRAGTRERLLYGSVRASTSRNPPDRPPRLQAEGQELF